MLGNISHFTLGSSIIKPDKLIQKYKELDYKVCVLCDKNTISGAVQFYKEAKKNEIKPVIGCEISLQGMINTVKIFPRNLDGWASLNKVVSFVNKQLPLGIKLDDLQELSDNFVVVGDDYFDNKFSTFFNINEVCDYDCRYLSPDQHIEFQIVQAISVKSTLQKCGQRTSPLYHLFNNNDYYVRSRNELQKMFTRKQIQNTHKLFELIENFDFLRKPQLPKFNSPDGMSSDDYLLRRCIEGAKQKLKNQTKEQKEKYWARLKEELEVFKEAKLADYFLIVANILDFCHKQNYLVGASRGSVGGCLVSYLAGITKIDPLQHDLIFSRFFNKGRIGSLPDIDFDVPKQSREHVIKYIENKYGKDKVGQIITYQTLKGRSSIKAVFRAIDMPFSEINRMTKDIEDEAKIADELNEEQPSVVHWALENKSDSFREWVELDDNGNLHGQYAKEFQIAINLEETKANASKHAAGVIISTEKLDSVVPMLYDKHSKGQVVGYEMNDAESVGLLKLDVLGLTTLDKIMDIRKLLNGSQ